MSRSPQAKSPSLSRIFRFGTSPEQSQHHPLNSRDRSDSNRHKVPTSDTVVFRSGARPLEDLAREMDDGKVLQEDSAQILLLEEKISEGLDENISRINEFKESFLSALNKHPSDTLISEIDFLAHQIEGIMQVLQPYNCGRFCFSLDKSIVDLKGRTKVERLVTAGTVGINYSLKILFGLKSGLQHFIGKRSLKFFENLHQTIENLSKLTNEKFKPPRDDTDGDMDESLSEKLRQRSEFIRGATERIFFKLTEYRRNILSCLSRGPTSESVLQIESLHGEIFVLLPILNDHMEARFSRAVSAIGVEAAPSQAEDRKRRLELYVTACAVALTHISRTLVNIKNEATTTKSSNVSESLVRTLADVLKGLKMNSLVTDDGLATPSSFFSLASLPTVRPESARMSSRIPASIFSSSSSPSPSPTPLPPSALLASPSMNSFSSILMDVTYDTLNEKVRTFLKQEPMEDHYVIGRQIGSGAYGIVKEVTHKASGESRAVKVVNIKGQAPDFVQGVEIETGILALIKHKYLVSLRDLFITPTEFQIVMDLIPGGELFDRIVEVSLFPEKEARRLVRQILEVVDYLHNLGIVHRDLKPENILLKSKRADTDLVIMDFGCAKLLNENGFSDAVGTLMYSAPEALLAIRNGGCYSKEVDIWSTGCIMYILMCGFPPFYDDDDIGIAEEIIHGRYSFPSPEWDEISSEAKDLVKNMFMVDPLQRISAKQALAHPWFSLAL